ncbi:protein required for sporulation, putative [Candida dubliniensis CD36]|uniref:Nitrogen permease regulator 3 n=1 Tax=Candida dubliniensis (strain CD36 / ATCC MYA-646 / CBS 7987 / NCPF 3949 / NRRL Y-17841) TaxID=573826 RepID=B9WMQ1_CANDC|nr:protein required for sporulation, putative [Candida dubliniensis CD36]CAX40366.1 protein required for sporulation, putative [Candida dubliniensis CD36]
MSLNLPNPSLIGILLVISTHSGPQLIYKYPFDLSNDSSRDESKYALDDNEDDELYDHEESEDENEMYGVNSRNWDSKHIDYYMGTKSDLLKFLDEQDSRRRRITTTSPSEDKHTKEKHGLTKTISKSSTMASSSITSPPEASIQGEIFGTDATYICEMLAPPKQMCNTRFEMAVQDKLFLGLPVHRQDNGQWRSIGHNNQHDEEELNETTEKTYTAKNSLNMFHLVFVMNPPVIESNHRVDEMFHYVISRLSLVLRYEQQKHDYVSQQVKNILALRESLEGNESLLTEKSSLSRVIRDCFEGISTSTIANLSINGKLRSFQIPIKTEFHSLPDPSVPFLPASYLSSTVELLGETSFINVGETSRYGHAFNPVPDEENSAEKIIVYFALLLLDDPESIIKDMKTENDSTLAKFIRMIEPTESLLKLSARNSNLDISQIKDFAFHLIYWRRARVILPLSSRSVYIVSPMAPITIKLYDDISFFNCRFPTLPSLPHFLKLLSPQSRKPQQFATVIPSKDHRDRYLQALGWLIKHGYVTQLQTFIWLKISRKIKIKVEEDIENENLAKKKKKQKNGSVSSKNVVTANSLKTETPIMPTDNTSKQVTNSKDSVKPNDDEFASKPHYPVLDGLHEHIDGTPIVTLVQGDDTIILDPGRATTLERRWINKIIYEECKLSPELTAVFYKLLKYMNGKHSLELLLLKENISRSELRKLLLSIEEHIISVRHW